MKERVCKQTVIVPDLVVGKHIKAALTLAVTATFVLAGSQAGAQLKPDTAELRPAPESAKAAPPDDGAGSQKTRSASPTNSAKEAASASQAGSAETGANSDQSSRRSLRPQGTGRRPFGARFPDYTQSGDALPQVAEPIPEQPAPKDWNKPDAEPDENETDLEKPSVSPRVSESDPNQRCEKAINLAKDKKYKEALDVLQKLMEQNPSYLPAQYQVAFVHQMMGDPKAALKEYTRYLRIKPDDLQARINLGTLLKTTGNQVGAEREFKRAVEVYFYCFPAHYNLANLLVSEGRLEEAQKEYKICLKLQPNNSMVHNNLGVIYQKRNYLEEAGDEFQKAARIDPGNKVFRTNLALVREQLKKGI